MKKTISKPLLIIIFLGQALAVFIGGFCALIFGAALISLALGGGLSEHWDNYNVPISKSGFFWISLAAIALGTTSAAWVGPEIFFLSDLAIIIIGLALTLSCFSIGWLSIRRRQT